MYVPSRGMSEGETTSNKVVNWRDYNRALRKRGSVALWISEDSELYWYARGHSGGRGAPRKYSDAAIQLALSVKVQFGLSLRATQGFLKSLFKMMGQDVDCPDYTTLSRRAKTVKVNIERSKPTEDLQLVVDSTGLKVGGAGEWHRRKHRDGHKRRRWMKLHLAVDADSQKILAMDLTTDNFGDAPVLPSLLEDAEAPVDTVYGDGAYDTKACHKGIQEHGAKAVIPPRKDAARWAPEHPRTRAVERCREVGRRQWKKEARYHKRSLAETQMFRFKRLIGDRLKMRRFAAQVAEAQIGVAILNRYACLGMPKREFRA